MGTNRTDKFDQDKLNEEQANRDEATAKRCEDKGLPVSAMVYRNEAYFRRHGMRSLTATETLDESRDKMLRRIR